jgi:hypothetical protein
VKTASCSSCLAFGHILPTHGLCAACNLFAHKYRADRCVGCGRVQPVRKRYCRLCWCQARTLAHQSGKPPHLAKAVHHLSEVTHHQLFFADMFATRGARTTPPRRYDRRGRPTKTAPPTAARPNTAAVQPFLFDGLHRDFTRFEEHRHPDSDNPWLAWARHLAHQLAETRGWSRGVRDDVGRALIVLLANHIDGDVVFYSDMFAALRKLDLSSERTAEVLDRMGIFRDDRRPSFEDWLDRNLDGIAPGIARETERWVRALRDGGPRIRQRNIATARIYLNTLRPVLLGWSAQYSHLREVNGPDVVTILDDLRGTRRQHTLIALRSLFGFCKKSGVVFRDPTSRIRVGEQPSTLVQPLSPEQIAQTIAAATRPADRLIVVLAAVHAARTGAIRVLQLDDIDLGNRRLIIGGHARPLDDPTRQILLDWLDYRRTRWPNTANAHLLINTKTAMENGPVNVRWISAGVRGQQATLERLRVDRQLEEALTHRADPLHLAVVFGLDEKTAIRYADAAKALMTTPLERDTDGSS